VVVAAEAQLELGPAGPADPPLEGSRLDRDVALARPARPTDTTMTLGTLAPMDLSVFFAGTGGSVPTPRRGLPALLVSRGGDRILIDCGEGTQRQLVRSVGLTDLDEIFLTHLHADHWLGLPGLLKTFDLRGRETPLVVHGPRGLRDLIDGVMRYAGRTTYKLYVDELEPDEILERDGYKIEAVSVSHRGPAFGYVLYENDRPGVFDPAKAIAAGLTEGPQFGRVQRGETVNGVSPDQVMGPRRLGRKLTVSGDTRPSEALRLAAHGSDVLIHEATFAIEEAERAHLTGHSTASQAAGIARDADVRLLVLNHLSTRYPASQLRDEAREIFADTVLPRDFDLVEIPLPERGRPELRRWPDAPAVGVDTLP
jgi:ribonuclease Z